MLSHLRDTILTRGCRTYRARLALARGMHLVVGRSNWGKGEQTPALRCPCLSCCSWPSRINNQTRARVCKTEYLLRGLAAEKGRVAVKVCLEMREKFEASRFQTACTFMSTYNSAPTGFESPRPFCREGGGNRRCGPNEKRNRLHTVFT